MQVGWFCLIGFLTLWCHGVTGSEAIDASIVNEGLLGRLEVVEKRGLQQDIVIRQLLETIDKHKGVINQQAEFIDKQNNLNKEQANALLKQTELNKEQANALLEQTELNKEQANALLKQTELNKGQADDIHKLVMDVEGLKQARVNTASLKEEGNGHIEGEEKLPTLTAHNPRTKVMSPSKRLVLDEFDGPIAFHARIDKGAIEHIGITQKLVFDITVLNMGGGYHNSTGVFTAPAPGLYFFSLSVCILHTGKDIHAELTKNGASVAGSYASGKDQGSVSTVIPLVAGDEVWVSSLHHPDTYLWGDTLTSLMGYRVAEM